MDTTINTFKSLQGTLTNLQKSMNELQNAFSMLQGSNVAKAQDDIDLSKLQDYRDLIIDHRGETESLYKELYESLCTFWANNKLTTLYPQDLRSLPQGIASVYINFENELFAQTDDGIIKDIDEEFTYSDLEALYVDVVGYVRNKAEELLFAINNERDSMKSDLVECLGKLLNTYCDDKLDKSQIALPLNIEGICYDVKNDIVKAFCHNSTFPIQQLLSPTKLSDLCLKVLHYIEESHC